MAKGFFYNLGRFLGSVTGELVNEAEDFFSAMNETYNRFDLIRYSENDLKFINRPFLRETLQFRFEETPDEFKWFLGQDKTLQRFYLDTLFEAHERSSYALFHESNRRKAQSLDPLSQEYKMSVMKMYGLNLWGNEFIKHYLDFKQSTSKRTS